MDPSNFKMQPDAKHAAMRAAADALLAECEGYPALAAGELARAVDRQARAMDRGWLASRRFQAGAKLHAVSSEIFD